MMRTVPAVGMPMMSDSTKKIATVIGVMRKIPIVLVLGTRISIAKSISRIFMTKTIPEAIRAVLNAVVSSFIGGNGALVTIINAKANPETIYTSAKRYAGSDFMKFIKLYINF
jgi:hypothetical protein